MSTLASMKCMATCVNGVRIGGTRTTPELREMVNHGLLDERSAGSCAVGAGTLMRLGADQPIGITTLQPIAT